MLPVVTTRTATDTSPAATESCPFCGTAFTRGCAACSVTCSTGKGCAELTCPGCGYRFVRPGVVSSWLARLLAVRRRRVMRIRTLADAPAGRIVCVEGFATSRSDRLSKLAAFGIVEGCELCVRRRRPAILVEVGETTLALDADVARVVLVSPARV